MTGIPVSLLREGEEQTRILGEFLARDGGDGSCDLAGDVADRDTDGLGAEIEAEHRHLGRKRGDGVGKGVADHGHVLRDLAVRRKRRIKA